MDWIGRAATELPVELFPDQEVLALGKMQMDPEQQTELSELLACNRKGLLTEKERIRLDELMQVYRRGLVCKAHAWEVAVERGLGEDQHTMIQMS